MKKETKTRNKKARRARAAEAAARQNKGKNRTLVMVALALVVVLVAASFAYRALAPAAAAASSSTAPVSAQGAQNSNEGLPQAPDFTVYGAAGEAVSFSDYLGKPIVLNFWASWCGPCIEEMPLFQQLYEEMGTDVHFLMVNLTEGSRETLDTAAAFLAQTGYTFPVLYDTESGAAAVYGVTAIPMTVYINADGYIASANRGQVDEDKLRRGIEGILP